MMDPKIWLFFSFFFFFFFLHFPFYFSSFSSFGFSSNKFDRVQYKKKEFDIDSNSYLLLQYHQSWVT